MLAHEISQPLAAILNYVDTARDQLARLSVTQSELAATINALEHAAREAMRASEIVGGIRAFIAGDDRVRLVEDLVTIVAEAVALTLVSTSDHAIRVSLDYADQKPCRVMVDRVQVQQVLSNLVRNAVNAMGGSGDLCVSIRCTDTSAIVRVADSGLGVGAPDEQMAAAAFDGTRMPGNGLGLGLSICRTIVEAHGGRIWARACPDSGAEFLFTLRLALSDPGDAR
jgi:two-component system sensor kinase FixL